jgi:hypothetical protein
MVCRSAISKKKGPSTLFLFYNVERPSSAFFFQSTWTNPPPPRTRTRDSSPHIKRVRRGTLRWRTRCMCGQA